ncbi:dephospho-CoA kinase [Oceanobacillus piezotolerans]|uniref:Dephospho-CoA kinase n=1 Tax=Oceanobacillus piezotolerans TaxID=2448030 RepID=A0A498DCD2_9BACI|nr:dephospho-CoA kinase [Oceanobacillus piezotolerans]RLL47892.1 dephospho-CoA kinase [Oceanobacillus piezotolerans]
MALIIGLTGSIASGKSTVSLMFDDLNIPVVDADKVAREVVYPGEPAYEAVVKEFGEGILRKDGTLDRKHLGSIVFSNKRKLETLNGIVHPAVRKRMMEKQEEILQQGANCVVLDIPLLYESELTHLVDKILVVYVDEDVQLQRLMKRDGFTEEEAMQRINAQFPVKKKAELADAIINNNGDKYKSFEQLEEILKDWKII